METADCFKLGFCLHIASQQMFRATDFNWFQRELGNLDARATLSNDTGGPSVTLLSMAVALDRERRDKSQVQRLIGPDQSFLTFLLSLSLVSLKQQLLVWTPPSSKRSSPPWLVQIIFYFFLQKGSPLKIKRKKFSRNKKMINWKIIYWHELAKKRLKQFFSGNWQQKFFWPKRL